MKVLSMLCQLVQDVATISTCHGHFQHYVSVSDGDIRISLFFTMWPCGLTPVVTNIYIILLCYLILRSRWWFAKHPGPDYFETLLLYQTSLQIDTSASISYGILSSVSDPNAHGRPPLLIHESNWGLEAIWRQRKLRNYWTKGKQWTGEKMSGAAVVRDLKPEPPSPWFFQPPGSETAVDRRASPIFGRVHVTPFSWECPLECVRDSHTIQ